MDRTKQAREIADEIIAGSKYEIPEGASRFMVRDLLESMFFAVMDAISESNLDRVTRKLDAAKAEASAATVPGLDDVLEATLHDDGTTTFKRLTCKRCEATTEIDVTEDEALLSRLRECCAYLYESLAVEPAAPLPDCALALTRKTLQDADAALRKRRDRA